MSQIYPDDSSKHCWPVILGLGSSMGPGRGRGFKYLSHVWLIRSFCEKRDAFDCAGIRAQVFRFAVDWFLEISEKKFNANESELFQNPFPNHSESIRSCSDWKHGTNLLELRFRIDFETICTKRYSKSFSYWFEMDRKICNSLGLNSDSKLLPG